MNEPVPMMIVFAGNNGSGKSTIRNLIADMLGISVHIDSDALARSMDAEHPDRRKVSAGKEAIRLARDCIRQKRNFSIETTLAGGNAIRLIQLARGNGFEVTMFYVGLGNYKLNIERVAMRVKNGGHDIPVSDIIRRETTSMQNLLAHLEMIDHLTVVDNTSASGETVLIAEKGQVKGQSEILPPWVERIKRHLK